MARSLLVGGQRFEDGGDRASVSEDTSLNHQRVMAWYKSSSGGY